MLNYQSRELLDSTFARLRGLSVVLLGGLFVEAVGVELMHWLLPFNGFNDPESGLSTNVQYLLLVVGVSDLVFLPFIRRSLLAVRPGAQPPKLISRMRVVSIVSLAIAHTPALLGLVIFLIWGTRWGFYALWLISLMFMLVYFPRQSFWEEWIIGGGRMEV